MFRLDHMAARTRSHYRTRHDSARGGDDGFTLVELIITTALLPIIMGSIVLALTTLLFYQGNVSHATADASDAQVVSSYYEQDVQASAYITTDASATQCGTGTQLLGLEWNKNPGTSAYQSVVSYNEVQIGSTYTLVRNYCASGVSSSPTTSSPISSDIPAALSAPTITPASSATAAAVGWTSTVPVTGVSFQVSEPLSHYTFSLFSVPRDNQGSADLSAVSNPTTSCGFASPGTGTYASTLCFVDFTSYNYTAPATGCGGNAQADTVTAAITNTPYTLTFCIVQSGTGPVSPWPIPTYNEAPTSEAFLGNNGFYTNIPGDSALYQTTQGTSTTVTITNIALLNSSGQSASGWDLVTGDAESTDAGESITWTSDQVLNILPNTSSSQIGNACAAPTTSNPNNVDLTGVGTITVECDATVSSDKTGTVMLEAAAPTKLSATLVGTGLEAIFVGVLLP